MPQRINETMQDGQAFFARQRYWREKCDRPDSTGLFLEKEVISRWCKAAIYN
jgi:hypothetical protein